MEPRFELDAGSVHIWTLRMGQAGGGFERVLSAEELERAGRFRMEHLRREYVLSTGALRMLAGRYAGVAPERLVWRTGPRGKPFLAGDLQFNISHSGGLAVLAFTRGSEIGVDVERIRPVEDLAGIAVRNFCREEAEELLALPAWERERAFFSCWTRKEAYIKATGEGLSVPLDRFRVALLPGERVRFVHIGGDAAAAGGWQLHDLALAPGYAGALAYRGREMALRVVRAMGPEELEGEIARRET
jgi:4'-phosphopantetheinyl transferase